MKDFNLNQFLDTATYEDFNDNWNLTKYVSSIIDSSIAREIIIHILDIWDKVNDQIKPIWLDLIENAGFYPYYVEKIENTSQVSYRPSFQQDIRTSFFKSDNLPNIYFHKEQKKIEMDLSAGRNVAVSAPTSFGKSLLIEEMVARKKYDNILIIQPTLALINETRKKLNKYNDFYNIVVNTKQRPKDKNIFILTAERVIEFANLPHIDFFVIDEFYKISGNRKDDRIDALNIALLKIMSGKPQAMFLTPTIDALSEKFQEKYNIVFHKTDYSLVNTDYIEIRNSNNNVIKAGKRKKLRLFKLLYQKLNGQSTIVYVKSPAEAYKLANEYLEYLNTQAKIVNPSLDIYEWMDRNISVDWSLKKMLMYGIGAHNGVLPRHIINSEIELFNTKKINILFSTASLIEGVNTIAENVVIYSQYKGRTTMDFFDFSNISGRAGRMNRYYTGHVYMFPERPPKTNFVLDVPAIDQKEVSDEILVNIPISDVKDRKRREEIENKVPSDLMNIYRKNVVSIEGQKKLVKYIFDNQDNVEYLKWKGQPTFEQLYGTLKLANTFLEKKSLSDEFSKRQTALCLNYVNLPLAEMIARQEKYFSTEESAIDDVLRFIRREAEYKIPKLLSIVDSLQKYVFQNNAIDNQSDYSMFISSLESGNLDPRVAFLIDYDVPRSALKKVMKLLSDNEENNISEEFFEENQEYLKKHLIPYEYNSLEKALKNLK